VTDADRADFASYYQNVHIATRNRDQVTAKVIGIYFHAVKALPKWAVKEASENLILNSKFPPTTADWRLEAERILAARPSPRLIASPVTVDPERVARIQAAKRKCIDELRAKPPNALVDWNRLADTFERMAVVLPPDPYCDKCDDTGWCEETCSAGDRCGRKMCEIAEASHTHTQVAPCVCRGTNPTLAARRTKLEEGRATRQSQRRKYA